MNRVTIRDIAKMLNLSPSTVSRALRDHPDISEATKRRVAEIAKSFNYVTNLHSNFFRTRKSNLIALVIPEVNMFFTPSLIEGIKKQMEESGYSLFVFISNDSYKKEKEIMEQCLQWAVEGILISLSVETESLDHLIPLSKTGVKTVLIDKIKHQDLYPSVTIDNKASSFMAIDHLIKNGHNNILGIFANPNLSITQERIEGYEQAFRKRNLEIQSGNVITLNKNSEINTILPIILTHNKAITAIFTMSDEILSLALYNIKSNGYRIPQDYTVISISDGIYPYLVYPNISFVKDSGFNLGKKATELILDLITAPSLPLERKIELKPHLVELDSIAKL